MKHSETTTKSHGTLLKGKPKAYKSVAIDAVVVKFHQISSINIFKTYSYTYYNHTTVQLAIINATFPCIILDQTVLISPPPPRKKNKNNSPSTSNLPSWIPKKQMNRSIFRSKIVPRARLLTIHLNRRFVHLFVPGLGRVDWQTSNSIFFFKMFRRIYALWKHEGKHEFQTILWS